MCEELSFDIRIIQEIQSLSFLKFKFKRVTGTMFVTGPLSKFLMRNFANI